MVERELCPLCGVPLDDEPGPVLEGDCPVHGVINRLRGVDDRAPQGLLGQESETGLSVWSADFGDTLPVGTAGWRKVDAFDVAEDGDARGFSITGEEDAFRSTQKLRYPDGATLEANGMAHEGGEAHFKLEGLQPGHDALLVERTDVMYAGGDLRLRVGDRSIVFPDFAPDRRYRARNRVIPIPGAWLTEETAQVSLGRLESSKDLSHFAVWVYQSRTPDPTAWGGDDLEDSVEDAPLAPEPVIEAPADPPPVEVAPLDTADVPDDSLADDSMVDDSVVDPPFEPEAAAEPEPALAPVEEDEPAPLVATVIADLNALEGGAAEPEPPIDDLPLEPEPEPPAAEAEPEPPTPEPVAEPEPTPEPTSAPEAAPPPSLTASEPAPPTAAPTGEQKLVTITLADADHPHGTAQAHLTDALRAGWRIGRLECLPGPRGGWLVVLLER